MLQINQVRLHIDHNPDQLKRKLAELLRIPSADILEYDILRQSIDARKKPDILFSYTVNVKVKNEEKILGRLKKSNLHGQIQKIEPVEYCFPQPGEERMTNRPIVVGSGPAGLFCAYYLARYGYRPILLERGRDVEARKKDVEEFWAGGPLNPDSNVQFGEGGAGTFSDGKLNTVVKDKSGRNREVLRTFVKFGAKQSIVYDAKPHVGTDVLMGIVRSMREEIIRLGGEVHFESCMTDIQVKDGRICAVTVNDSLELACDVLVLALGHSARDTFYKLYERHVAMEPKAFAVGLRVEHPQKMINFDQYGIENPGRLGAAPYKVTARTTSGRGVYSFCMCPGGYVVNASSEKGRLAINGMSYSGRDGANANSAIIVSVTPKDFESGHPLAGVEFQRNLEKKAYELAGGRIPVERYGDFFAEVQGEELGHSVSDPAFLPTCKGAYAWAKVSSILPVECNHAFVEGMEVFGRQISGFDSPDAILSGVESRTSSPVRIMREKNLESVSVKGLFPCGEGAGYAGGITSAAMDGLRVAEVISSRYAPFST